MIILPALDFRGGVLDRAPHTDRAHLLRRWKDAPWLHVADLDRAFGTGQNDALVARVLAEATRPVQVSGEGWLEQGAARVLVSGDTIERDWAPADPGKLGVTLDVREGRTVGGADPVALAERVVAAGVRTLVWRDRARDGTLTGAALAVATTLIRLGANVQYAGGVASLDDLRRAQEAGFAGVIVGRALLDGTFTLEEALACLV